MDHQIFISNAKEVPILSKSSKANQSNPNLSITVELLANQPMVATAASGSTASVTHSTESITPPSTTENLQDIDLDPTQGTDVEETENIEIRRSSRTKTAPAFYGSVINSDRRQSRSKSK